MMDSIFSSSSPRPHASARHQALHLHDSLAVIFAELDRASLAAAVRVCRAWAACATRLLWSEPAPRALDAVADDARRQLVYAPAIRSIIVRARDARLIRRLAVWTLPRLRSLHVDRRFVQAHRGLFLRLLRDARDTLTSVKIQQVGADAAAAVAAATPNVDDEDDVMAALAQLPRLASLTADAMSLRRAALAQVSASASADADAAARAPFRRLRSFTGSSCPDSVPQLAALLQTSDELTYLKLEVLVGDDNNAFDTAAEASAKLSSDNCDEPFPLDDLARLTHLQELILCFRRSPPPATAAPATPPQPAAPTTPPALPDANVLTLPPPSSPPSPPPPQHRPALRTTLPLPALQRLTQLRRLRILSGSGPLRIALRVPSFGDAQLLALAERLPHLRELALDVQTGVSDAAFRLVGEQCRALRRLALSRCLADLSVLRLPAGAAGAAAAAVFPELEELSVAGAWLPITTDDASHEEHLAAQVREAARLLKQHAPKLTQLDFQRYDELENSLRDCYSTSWRD